MDNLLTLYLVDHYQIMHNILALVTFVMGLISGALTIACIIKKRNYSTNPTTDITCQAMTPEEKLNSTSWILYALVEKFDKYSDSLEYINYQAYKIIQSLRDNQYLSYNHFSSINININKIIDLLKKDDNDSTEKAIKEIDKICPLLERAIKSHEYQIQTQTKEVMNIIENKTGEYNKTFDKLMVQVQTSIKVFDTFLTVGLIISLVVFSVLSLILILLPSQEFLQMVLQ